MCALCVDLWLDESARPTVELQSSTSTFQEHFCACLLSAYPICSSSFLIRIAIRVRSSYSSFWKWCGFTGKITDCHISSDDLPPAQDVEAAMTPVWEVKTRCVLIKKSRTLTCTSLTQITIAHHSTLQHTTHMSYT